MGPNQILENLADGRSCKLNLPAEFKNKHTSFHVSLLKQYRQEYMAQHEDSQLKQSSPMDFMNIDAFLNPEEI